MEERSKRIIWVDYTASADASILELALIVTTHTLDEVERRAWTFSDGDVHSRDTEIVAFLHEHSAERPKVAGAASLSLLLPVLRAASQPRRAFRCAIALSFKKRYFPTRCQKSRFQAGL